MHTPISDKSLYHTVRDYLSWKAYVHGYCVNPSTSPLLSSFPRQLDSDSLTSLIAGNDVEARLDTFAPAELNGEWYNQTVHVKAYFKPYKA